MIAPNVNIDFANISELGEGALWDDRQRLLYWVDIIANKVYVYNPRNRSNLAYDVGQSVGTVVLTENGHLLLGLRNGIAVLDPNTGQVKELTRTEEEMTNTRLNCVFR